MQISEAVAEYTTHHKPTGEQSCPLFQQLLPTLLDDKGEKHRLTEPGTHMMLNALSHLSPCHLGFSGRGKRAPLCLLAFV
jgi:hypothetical protein